ncbi:MAG: prolyl oligopeptidase family serine peptidase [Isosphaeraceae bacterium]
MSLGITRRWWMVLAFLAIGIAPARGDDAPRPLQESERRQIEGGLQALRTRLNALKQAPARDRDRLADAEVFAKGIDWALRHDTTYTAADRDLLRRALVRCGERLAALEGSGPRWVSRTGKVVRGFTSKLDGSVQPYGVVVPRGYDPSRPLRLDVVLHGSSKPAGMSELRFVGRFDEGDGAASEASDAGFLELHPLGRVENGYRWGGETDVFEAIEAACRAYNVDRDRIVLRGMSMGASGTWHLGLKHPDRFVALGPYCGYVDTHGFSKTPLPTFVKVGALPAHQEKMLHLLDSVDYAANAGMVPAIACMGEKDVFFEAHEIMKRAMASEGLAMVNLISPGTGHVVDPVTQNEQLRRIGEIAARGLDRSPRHIRFVTWSLKYSRCHWLEVLGLGEHYARAEIEAWHKGDGAVELAEPKNVTRFAILSPIAQGLQSIRIGGDLLPLPDRGPRPGPPEIWFEKRGGRWGCRDRLDRATLVGKRPGLQGPIDDAFTAPFLCVRGTGEAWSPVVRAWADARLRQFAAEWSRYFRGELPIKDDTAVSDEDARRFHLILFGDPGSNAWIARVLPQLPVRWTRQNVSIGTASAPAADHAPVFIQPNPLAPGRYVVVNSGHTFGERELSTLNYLLFPRLGDWAIVRATGDPARPLEDAVVRVGFFDEHWASTLPAEEVTRDGKRVP